VEAATVSNGNDISECEVRWGVSMRGAYRLHFGGEGNGNSTSVFLLSQSFDKNEWVRLIATVFNEQYILYIINNDLLQS
jgi:hypothetical protein